MKQMKRLISLFLILTIVLGMVTVLAPEAQAATTLTLDQLKQKYPEGKYWNHYVSNQNETTDALCDYADESFATTVTNYPCPYHESTSANTYVGGYSCNYFSNGYQCNGFAKWMAYEAYGSRITSWSSGNINTLKPGDVIHYRGAGAGEYWGHWVFVIAVYGTTITVGECNWDGRCGISWSRSFDLNSASSYEIYSAPHALGTVKVNAMIRHWISATDMGDSTDYIGSSQWAYLCFELYDKETGKPINELVDYSYIATLSLYMPNGELAYSDDFNSQDNGWIAIKRSVLGTYTYSVSLSGDFTGIFTGDFQMYDTSNTVLRLAGKNRYETAFKVADQLQAEMGVQKFDAVIVTSGSNFADALSGSYLASVKKAPILLSHKNNNTYNEQVKEYIRKNLNKGGTVYILGGTAAVPSSMEKGLEGFTIRRLAGNTRYDTNLAILKEAGVGSKEILVCTGTDFADSLSASATGLPILLLNTPSGKLTSNQKSFLSGLNGNRLCIIGGENAVSKKMENAIKSYGNVSRLAGSDRYETSVLVAERFFYYPDQAVLAYSQNYPDGLCGGVLANVMGCPMILTKTGRESQASGYVRGLSISSGVVLGGTSLISTKSINNIFAMSSNGRIISK